MQFIFVTIDFFGGYDLYIIAIMSPLELERAAEARRAVVASNSNYYDLLLSPGQQKLRSLVTHHVALLTFTCFDYRHPFNRNINYFYLYLLNFSLHFEIEEPFNQKLPMISQTRSYTAYWHTISIRREEYATNNFVLEVEVHACSTSPAVLHTLVLSKFHVQFVIKPVKTNGALHSKQPK